MVVDSSLVVVNRIENIIDLVAQKPRPEIGFHAIARLKAPRINAKKL